MDFAQWENPLPFMQDVILWLDGKGPFAQLTEACMKSDWRRILNERLAQRDRRKKDREEGQICSDGPQAKDLQSCIFNFLNVLMALTMTFSFFMKKMRISLKKHTKDPEIHQAKQALYKQCKQIVFDSEDKRVSINFISSIHFEKREVRHCQRKCSQNQLKSIGGVCQQKYRHFEQVDFDGAWPLLTFIHLNYLGTPMSTD